MLSHFPLGWALPGSLSHHTGAREGGVLLNMTHLSACQGRRLATGGKVLGVPRTTIPSLTLDAKNPCCSVTGLRIENQESRALPFLAHPPLQRESSILVCNSQYLTRQSHNFPERAWVKAHTVPGMITAMSFSFFYELRRKFRAWGGPIRVLVPKQAQMLTKPFSHARALLEQARGNQPNPGRSWTLFF